MPPESALNVTAENVPPVRFSVEFPPALFTATLPLICRMPTVALPPVWVKVPVVFVARLLSERAIPNKDVGAMFKFPVSLRLKTPVAPVFTPTSTPKPAIVFKVPLLRL